MQKRHCHWQCLFCDKTILCANDQTNGTIDAGIVA